VNKPIFENEKECLNFFRDTIVGGAIKCATGLTVNREAVRLAQECGYKKVCT